MGEGLRFRAILFSNHRPILQQVQDERILGFPSPQLAYHVIPRVAEESAMPGIDSISGFLDSSATLGMTWERGCVSVPFSLATTGINPP